MLGEKYSRGKIQKGNYLIAQGQFSPPATYISNKFIIVM